MKSDMIELEKQLLDYSGNPLETCNNNITCVINSDKKGFIYVGCLERKNINGREDLNYFIKLNDKFDNVWTSSKEKYYGLFKLVENDDFYFYFNNNGQTKIIDNVTGNTFDLENAKQKIKNLPQLDYSSLIYKPVNYHYRNVKFDSTSNSIKVYKGEVIK